MSAGTVLAVGGKHTMTNSPGLCKWWHRTGVGMNNLYGIRIGSRRSPKRNELTGIVPITGGDLIRFSSMSSPVGVSLLKRPGGACVRQFSLSIYYTLAISFLTLTREGHARFLDQLCGNYAIDNTKYRLHDHQHYIDKHHYCQSNREYCSVLGHCNSQ